MKTWREIETSRERRLWITQVGLPLLGFMTLFLNTDCGRNVKDNLTDKARATVNRIKDQFVKKSSI